MQLPVISFTLPICAVGGAELDCHLLQPLHDREDVEGAGTCHNQLLNVAVLEDLVYAATRLIQHGQLENWSFGSCHYSFQTRKVLSDEHALAK